LEGNTFLRGKDFSFYYMFKTNFSGHKKLEGLPPNAPLGYGPACKANVSHLDENIAVLWFWLTQANQMTYEPMHSAQVQSVRVTKKYILDLLVTIFYL